jgi:hypothetical protein
MHHPVWATTANSGDFSRRSIPRMVRSVNTVQSLRPLPSQDQGSLSHFPFGWSGVARFASFAVPAPFRKAFEHGLPIIYAL